MLKEEEEANQKLQKDIKENDKSKYILNMF